MFGGGVFRRLHHSPCRCKLLFISCMHTSLMHDDSNVPGLGCRRCCGRAGDVGDFPLPRISYPFAHPQQRMVRVGRADCLCKIQPEYISVASHIVSSSRIVCGEWKVLHGASCCRPGHRWTHSHHPLHVRSDRSSDYP